MWSERAERVQHVEGAERVQLKKWERYETHPDAFICVGQAERLRQLVRSCL